MYDPLIPNACADLLCKSELQLIFALMITTLLLDLGGVVMDIERERAVAALNRLGMTEADGLLDPYTQKGPFLQLEAGLVSPDEFRQEIRRYLPAGAQVSDDAIDDAFTEFLIGIPVRRLHALEELGRHFRICMLSNTNPIMWNRVILKEFGKDGYGIGHYFDGVVTSFEAKCVKPDPRIFAFAASKLGLDPAETLFIDDSEKNVEAAITCGYQGLWLQPGIDFADLKRVFNNNC